jgi:16S rRNA (adenine1518-N6/adenine1519-N6)-dimethyltransferase
MSAQSRSEIAELLDRHGLAPIHRLGQHFLADPNITRKIVALAGIVPGDKVIEVGAGTGTLTRALARSGADVLAFEVDGGLEPLLREAISGLDVDLVFEDVMTTDMDGRLGANSWKLVANLPYNVGTPFLLGALRELGQIELFVVMVQREVADRLCAEPGGRDYGLPSVIARIYSNPVLEFTVPPQVFYPAPRVGSAVVSLRRTPAPPNADRAVDMARAAFGQRRKMLRRSLSGLLADPVAALEAADIDPTRRAEELSTDDYLRLAAV